MAAAQLTPPAAQRHPASEQTSAQGTDASPQRPPRGIWRRLGTALVCLLAGLLIAATATTAGGSDLRPTRADDLAGLVRNQTAHNADLAKQLNQLRAQVDALSAQQGSAVDLQPSLTQAGLDAGTSAVHGPAVRVSLTDAPLSVSPPGVDPDMLVVHQQDIQNVMNALWTGGAEAMTLQGVRVISTTGVKCVGNTVVVHGTPYAPPYVITAIGDQNKLESALAGSQAVRIYRQYANTYQLGYAQNRIADVTMPGYDGPTDLSYARPVR